VDIFTNGPRDQFVDLNGVYKNEAPAPSLDFQEKVRDLVDSAEYAAADLRYHYRLSKDAAVYVKLPRDMDQLPVFLAAAAALDVRKIKIDWSEWYAGH